MSSLLEAFGSHHGVHCTPRPANPKLSRSVAASDLHLAGTEVMLCWRTSGKLHGVAQWKGTLKPKREYKEYIQIIAVCVLCIYMCIFVYIYIYVLMITMYNVQPSSIYIFKRRPPRADPQTEAGKNAAMPRLRHVSGRAASADAQWLRPRPPGPCLDDFWGVVQICLACLWMMDDGLLLKVFDVWCVAMLLRTMIISVL